MCEMVWTSEKGWKGVKMGENKWKQMKIGEKLRQNHHRATFYENIVQIQMKQNFMTMISKQFQKYNYIFHWRRSLDLHTKPKFQPKAENIHLKPIHLEACVLL